MTSCNTSDDDTTATLGAVCKFYQTTGGYYFRTTDGVMIYPTTSSLTSLTSSSGSTTLQSLLGHVVQFWFTYDTSTVETGATTYENVTAYGIIDMDNPVEYVASEGAVNDSVANAPIIALEYGSNKPYAFDSETIVLPINHYVANNYHNFTLVCYPDEQMDDNTLTLHLRHNTAGDNATASSYTAYQWWSQGVAISVYYHAFDLGDVINTTGITPTTVNIVCQESENTVDLSSATETTYSISMSN
ncbi:MAG: hypothetical protein Q4D56_07370 [Bacteroides sp.]|nr:hypothetical protein [Bacteroides sp.]